MLLLLHLSSTYYFHHLSSWSSSLIISSLDFTPSYILCVFFFCCHFLDCRIFFLDFSLPDIPYHITLVESLLFLASIPILCTSLLSFWYFLLPFTGHSLYFSIILHLSSNTSFYSSWTLQNLFANWRLTSHSVFLSTSSKPVYRLGGKIHGSKTALLDSEKGTNGLTMCWKLCRFYSWLLF